MTLYPVLPPLLLVAVAALLVGARVVAFRQWQASGRHRTALWRWLGLTSAAILLLIAAARIVIVVDVADAIRSAADTEPNVFLLVDRSPDMAVRDLADRTRMEVARDDVEALLDRYPHARFAVIEFASAPALTWPLSADIWSLRPVLDALTPYGYGPDAVTQANAGAANTVLRYQLISAIQQYPRAANLVYYLGAGARESRVPARTFDPPMGAIDGGAVLGYGTATGGHIPGTGFERSSVDDAALRTAAGQLGVPYVARTHGAPLAGVPPDGGTGNLSATTIAAERPRTETYWLPALAAAALILIEAYLVLRDFLHSRLAGLKVVP
jgi:Ca-activated chloride channel homolog